MAPEEAEISGSRLFRQKVAERERIEHSSTCKQADGRFEDGGGHQAPITLRAQRKETTDGT